VVHAFSGQAAAVFQQVARANPTATADELWAAMERRLYNVAQVQSQRSKFYEVCMKRGESVEKLQRDCGSWQWGCRRALKNMCWNRG
jgi:hypothetical protein